MRLGEVPPLEYVEPEIAVWQMLEPKPALAPWVQAGVHYTSPRNMMEEP